MRAAFALLDTATEPTIDDYPIDAPGSGPEAWSCPLNLATATDESLTGRLRAEVDRLRPWAAETRRQRGRTMFGLSGAAADQVDEVAAALAAVAESGDLETVPTTDFELAHDMPFVLRHLADDLRSYYHEAIAAQPGDIAPNHDALNEWIFGQTAFGELLVTIGAHLTAAEADNPFAPLVRNLIIPEGHYRGIANFEGIVGGHEPTPAEPS